MRFAGKAFLGLFLLSLTLGLFAFAGLTVRDAVQARMSDSPRERPARERVFTVNVLPVVFETITPELNVFGEVQSLRTLELRAASAGALMELAPGFVEGGKVSKGQLLARVDPANAQAALDRAQSDLLDAQAEQREANRAITLAQDEVTAAQEQVGLREKALQRQSDLVARNVGTAEAVETAELALSSAKQAVLNQRQALATAEARIDQSATRLRRAEIALSDAQRGVADTEIRAAFDGSLSEVTVVAGRLVSQNEKLANLVDSTALEVAFRVSTQQYARLLDEQGQLQDMAVQVSLEGLMSDITVSGRLTREGASVGDGLTGRLLFAELDDPVGLKPGDFVQVSLQEAPLRFVAKVPATAVSAAQEVLALGEEDRLEVVQVQLLRRQGDDVLIRSRDLRDRQIVAERTPLLGAGIKVNPLAPGGATQAPEATAMVALTEERRAKLIATVEGNQYIPADAKKRILSQLEKPEVPARIVDRLEGRAGG